MATPAPVKHYPFGCLVWAKLKGFTVWPAKVIEPKQNVKMPKNAKEKTHFFVFFFGSENYAWVPWDMIWPYDEYMDRLNITARVPAGFKEAQEKMEAYKSGLKDPAPLAEDPPPEPAPEPPKPAKTATPKAAAPKSSSKSASGAKGSAGKSSASKADAANTSAHSAAADAYTFTGDKSTASKAAELVKKKYEKGGSKRSSGASGKSSDGPAAKKQKLQVRLFGKGGSPKKSTSPPKGGDDASWTNMKVHMSRPAPVKPELPDIGTVISTPVTKSIIATPSRLGFLGLGIMGHGIVTNLLRSGHEVTVWNRTTSKCEEFVRHGAMKGESPSEVMRHCDIVFCCLSDPAAVRDVVFGSDGLLEELTPGKGLVNFSTIDPETCSDVSEAVTLKSGRFLEAPISGSKDQAMNGQLVLMAAGDRSLYHDCSTCFDAIAKKTFYLGEAGYGSRTKLVVNQLMGTWTAGLAEAFSLAQRTGVDMDILNQILEMGATNCPLLKVKGRAMREGRFSPHLPLRLMQKDLRLSLQTGDQVLHAMPVTAAANELFKTAKYLGYGDHDVSAVYKAIDL